jgi:DNA repair protein RadC
METDFGWVEPLASKQPRVVGTEAKHRLLRLGASALSDAELVALVAGVSHEAALHRVLEFGLSSLGAQTGDTLMELEGVGAMGAARLLASMELARRLSAPPTDGRPRLTTPSSIYEWARTRLVGSRREEFHVLCLNARNVLVRHVRVAEGSVDQCHVDPREVFGPAVSCRATAIVLVHNHPSGDPEPSVQDVALTRQLREGARLLCIRLVDHLVITERGYVSMLVRGLFGPDFGVPQLHTPNRLT